MQQNNWVKLLLLIQLIISNKISITTKQLLFRTNHDMDSNIGQMSKKNFQNIMEFQKIWIKMKT